MASPAVSVIIPFYRRADWLSEAIDSVLAQTFADFEIILVDDGSPEDISAIVTRDHRIRYLRQVNQGPATARNAGIQLAHGRLIAFLDADDVFMPEKLARQVALFRDKPHAILAHTSYQRMDEAGQPLEVIHSGAFRGNQYPEILWNCPIATPTVMLRREALGQLHFEAGMRTSEDTLLWTRLSRLAPLESLDQPLSYVRFRADSAALDPVRYLDGTEALLRIARQEDPALSPAYLRRVRAKNYQVAGNAFLKRHDMLHARAALLRSAILYPLNRHVYLSLARAIIPEFLKQHLRRA